MNGFKNFEKISFQQELLKKIYKNIVASLNPIEYLNLERINFARLSFILAILYSYDHSENIINNLKEPEIYNQNNF